MGCYSCCNAIYDLLVSIPYEIECYALGAIQGAPMSIFMAGIERYMSDSTRVFLGLSNKKIPKFLILLGIMWGIGNILTAISQVFQLNTLIYFISMQVLVFAPLWGFSEGFYLLYMVKTFSEEKVMLNK